MSALIRVVFLLPKKSSALVGHWYSVLAVNIQLLLGSSQLLLELVNVGNLHSVHKRQPLQSMRRSRKLELSMRVSCTTLSVLTVCVCRKSCTTYRPSEDDCSGMKVYFHNVTLGNDLHT